MIIDTHTHLEQFNDRGVLEDTLGAARDAGLNRMITVGTDLDDWGLYQELAANNAGFIDFTVGVHPCSVGGEWNKAVDGILSFFEGKTKPVALGEIGLDRFHLPKEEAAAKVLFSQQSEAFCAQLAIAKALECPVVIHSRGAFDECVQIIDESGVDWRKVVFHCFSEGPSEMQQLLDRGGFGSFTGVITFKNAESVREAAKLQGIERLMIETDAPYLAPMPHRGKRNEPAYLRHTAEFCADLFSMEFEAFSSIVRTTSERFYGLK